jgi:hypothetical protein
MYVPGYLQGSENGRVVTIVSESSQGITIHQKWLKKPIYIHKTENAFTGIMRPLVSEVCKWVSNEHSHYISLQLVLLIWEKI